MATIETYPHYIINLRDDTIFEPVVLTKLPLHRPLYIIKAAKGELDKIGFYPQFHDAEKEFGSETFDMYNKKYFSMSSYYLTEAFKNNGNFIMRVAGDTASEAFVILEAHVKHTDIIQYTKDGNGNYVLSDGTAMGPNGVIKEGEPIPLMDGGEVKTEPGVEISYSTRSRLTSAEKLAGVDIYNLHKIQPTSDGTSTTYPILAFRATNPGAWGNDVGFELYYDSDINDIDILARQGGVSYVIEPKKIDRHINNATPIRNKYNSVRSSFVFKEDAIDEATTLAVGMGRVLENSYDDEHKLPYSITVFEKWIEKIGEVCIDAMKDSAEDTFLTLTTTEATRVVGTKAFAIDGGISDELAEDLIIGMPVAGDKLPDGTTLVSYSTEDGTITVSGSGLTEQVEGAIDLALGHTPPSYEATAKRLAYLKSGFAVNIISGRDLENKPYDLVKVVPFTEDGDSAKAELISDATHYLGMGLDGDISDPTIEAKVREILTGEGFPDIVDQARYPITHIFDPGYTKETKFAMIGFTDIRHDVKSTVGTHMNIGVVESKYLNGIESVDDGSDNPDNEIGKFTIAVPTEAVTDGKVSLGMHVYGTGIAKGTDVIGITTPNGSTVSTVTLNKPIDESSEVGTSFMFGNGAITRPNTQAEDEALLATLHTRALLSRESVAMGTSACRTTIFTQCGMPHDNLNTWVSTVLWAVSKKAEYQNLEYLDREPKGLPNSDISLFKKFNWVPSGASTKSRIWDAGGNYCQYYDMESLHYPSVKSVYPYASSVLVDDFFTDAVVYMKHVVRRQWATYVGITLPFEELSQMVEDALFVKLSQMINGKYVISVNAYQDDFDKKMGDRMHIDISVTVPGTIRVWDVTIICNRENFNTGGE